MLKLFFCSFAFIAISFSFGQTNYFVKNEGQIVDQNGQVRADIQYSLQQSNTKFFITNSGFSIQLDRKIDSLTVYSERIDYSIENFKPTVFLPSNKQDYFETHITNDGTKRVLTYQDVIAIDKNSGIKLHFYSNETGFKYDLILPSNYPYNSVNINVAGANVGLLDNQIELETRENKLIESMPKVYSVNGNSRLEKSADYELTDSGYSIQYSSYDGELVIDPYIIYSTYYGGSFHEHLYGVGSDSISNTYACGTTSSSSNIATSGAYFQTNSIYGNMFLVKFDDEGQRQWGTYIHSSYPNPRKLEIDGAGNIYMAGITGSGDNLATPGAHQEIFGGDYNDTFLAKFTNDGFPIWSTLYGGEGNDILNGLAMSNDALYLTGYTSSHTQISTPGSFLDTTMVSGWNNDGFIAKFDTSGVLEVATYVGGYNDNKLSDIKYYDNNVYAVGAFNTWDKGTPGAYLPTKTSNSDMFFTKFDENLNQVWGSYFTGNRHVEGLHKIAVNQDKLYIAAYVNADAGNSSYTTANAHKEFSETGYEVYVQLFDTSGTNWIKGTLYGGADGDYIADITILNDSMFAITGNTVSLDQIAMGDVHKNYFTYSSGAWSLNNDVFVAVFNDSLEQVWGSYYGGEGQEFSYDMTSNSKNQLIIGGYTTSQNGVAYGQAHQQFNGGLGAQPDGFLAVFDADRDSVFTDHLQTLSADICPKENLSIPFEIEGTFYNDNVFQLWLSDEFGDFTNASMISAVQGQNSGAFNYQVPYLITGGNYKFRVDATSPPVTGLVSGDVSILDSPLANFTYQIGINDVYFTDASMTSNSWQWNFGDGATSITQNPSHIYTAPGMYNVSLEATNASCVDTAFHQVLIEEILAMDSELSPDIELYPNPSREDVNIRLNNFQGNILIKSLDGKLIQQIEIKNQKQITVSLENGVYIASFINGYGKVIAVKKVIKL